MKESCSWANKIFTLFIDVWRSSFIFTNKLKSKWWFHTWMLWILLAWKWPGNLCFFCYWLACWRLSHLVFELFRFELGISLLFIGCSLNILNNLGLFWFWIKMGCVGVTWLSRPSDSRRVRARSWLPPLQSFVLLWNTASVFY